MEYSTLNSTGGGQCLVSCAPSAKAHWEVGERDLWLSKPLLGSASFPPKQQAVEGGTQGNLGLRTRLPDFFPPHCVGLALFIFQFKHII